MENWKCVIRDHPYDLSIDLFVYRQTSGNELEYVYVGKNGEFLIEVVRRYEPLKPFLTLPEMMAKELFSGLAQALDKQGYKTESNSKLEGLLEATKYHLEDLRKIAKLK